MQQGWIKLHRSIRDNDIFNDPQLLRLWIICLLEATHKERDQLVGKQVVHLIPGQFVTGRFDIQELYNEGLKPKDRVKGKSTVYRWLEVLEKAHYLNIKKTTKYSVISITKWNEYQQNEQQMNNKRTTNEHQMNTNKNVKNDKENNSPAEAAPHIPYKEIIEYLNSKTGKSFKHTSQASQKTIKARFNEGYTLEDFKRVIDIKSSQWINGDMEKYLRVSTLFGNKFDGYLNEEPQHLKQPKPKTITHINYNEGEED